MTNALEVRGLAKSFGDVTALRRIDLTVEQGAVYGFLGPNGAGKTTALRLITGLARQDGGSVSIFGKPAGSRAARRLTGYLPDVPGYYSWMKAEEFLRFAGGLFGIDRRTLDHRVSVLLELAGLGEVRTPVGGYSRGMKQRLGVAQALINAPRLLLLDEPTSALDPIGRKDVLDMIASLKGRTTVFFSTHVLADVERVCDTVAILDRGRVVVESSIEQLKESHSSHRISLTLSEEAPHLATAITGMPWVSSVHGTGGSLSVEVNDPGLAARELPRIIAEARVGLERYESEEVSLEDVFVELVGSRSR